MCMTLHKNINLPITINNKEKYTKVYIATSIYLPAYDGRHVTAQWKQCPHRNPRYDTANHNYGYDFMIIYQFL